MSRFTMNTRAGKSDRTRLVAVLLIITLIVSAFNVAFTGAAQASESIPSTPVSLSPANGATVYTLTPRIQWQASADNETFSIQMAADYRFSKLILEQKDITDPYYDVTGLNRNTAYYWRVSAQNSAGISSAWSSMSYFRTTSSLPPNQPENLTAVVVLPGQIVLNWEDKSDNEIKFKIERKTGSGDYFLVTALRSNVVSYIDTNLISDTTYSYRIRAYGIAGDSAYSNEASATTLPPPLAAPILSEPVSNAIVSTLTLRMQWHESPEMTRYGIQIATDNDFANLIVSETNLTSSYYDVPSDALTWKSLYFWRVRGQSGSGMISDWSQPWYFTTFPESSSAFSCGCARR